MKHLKTFIFALLAIFGLGQVWATDATFSWTAGGTMGSNATGTQGQITLTGAANDASGAPAVNSNTLRLYAKRQNGNGASATFTAATGYQITAFTVTSSNGGSILKYALDGGSSYTGFTFSNGSASINNLTVSSFTLKNCQSSGSSNTTIQIASVVVTYESTGGGTPKPTGFFKPSLFPFIVHLSTHGNIVGESKASRGYLVSHHTLYI